MLNGSAGVREEGGAPLAWEDFLARLDALSGELAGDWDQEAYVRRVAALLETVRGRPGNAPGRPPFAALPRYRELKHTREYQVISIRFAPGQSIPAHDHPRMTGVLGCAGGSVEVESFDLPQTSPDGNLLLRLARRRTLSMGMTASLTARRENIHRLRALSSAEIVDIFTPPYTSERLKGTRWYALSPAPVRPGSRYFPARSVDAPAG